MFTDDISEGEITMVPIESFTVSGVPLLPIIGPSVMCHIFLDVILFYTRGRGGREGKGRAGESASMMDLWVGGEGVDARRRRVFGFGEYFIFEGGVFWVVWRVFERICLKGEGFVF